MNQQTRRAWAGLVSYANGLVTNVDELRRIVTNCMPWVTAAVEPLVFGFSNMMAGESSNMMAAENLLKQAVEYRSSVNVLLRWLCSAPNSKERESSFVEAISFLLDHAQHVQMHFKEVFYVPAVLAKLNYTPIELENFREQHDRILADKDSSPFGLFAPSKGYQELADPICDFLLSEYQRYLNVEYSRRDRKRPPVAPIFVCPKCDKLVMPERTGRKNYCSECSDQARAEKYRQKAPPNENMDYQWLYRLKQIDQALRRIRLRNPKNQERLQEIKARQRNSSRCQSLLRDMRL